MATVEFGWITDAGHVQTGRHDVDHMSGLMRESGRPLSMTAGQRAISGVRIPPSYADSLVSRRGVLLVVAHARPYAANVS